MSDTNESLPPTYRIPIYGSVSEVGSIINDICKYEAILICNSNNSQDLIRDSGYAGKDVNGCNIYYYSKRLIPYKYNEIIFNEDGTCCNRYTVFDGTAGTNSTLSTGVCRIYDGDLPLIDISLLCRSDNSTFISTNIIECDPELKFDASTGEFTCSSSNAVVSVCQLCEVINNVATYLTGKGNSGTESFWTTPVQVTK